MPGSTPRWRCRTDAMGPAADSTMAALQKFVQSNAHVRVHVRETTCTHMDRQRLSGCFHRSLRLIDYMINREAKLLKQDIGRCTGPEMIQTYQLPGIAHDAVPAK